MDDTVNTQEVPVEIDERWMGEWLGFGYAELTRYLSKHAAFHQYLLTNHPHLI